MRLYIFVAIKQELCVCANIHTSRCSRFFFCSSSCACWRASLFSRLSADVADEAEDEEDEDEEELEEDDEESESESAACSFFRSAFSFARCSAEGKKKIEVDQ